jgi:hypothetical protein
MILDLEREKAALGDIALDLDMILDDLDIIPADIMIPKKDRKL